MNDDQNSKKIRDTIMKELDLEGLDEEKQEDLLAKMGEVILKKIFIETMEKLDDGSRVEFEDMLEGETSPEDIEKFLSEKIPDFESMVERIVLELKEELMKTEEE